nr:PREDICTED: tripartite motif-containing protein 44 [Anolis carolinensis]|eukprot:XP_008104116.1 PREDICTED: tripartite motif-containing protein 44 [Anolis carolinensis]
MAEAGLHEGPEGEPRSPALKKCEAHGQELGLYCQEHQELVCVVCALVGPHRHHRLLTLGQAYRALRDREPINLKAAMLEMVRRLQFKCADPKVTQGDMKQCIQQEFTKVRHQICEEERQALHLLDLQEALAIVHTTEILADIDARMAKLMTEMAELTRQLDIFNELALLKPESIDEETRPDQIPPPNLPQRNRRDSDDDPSLANGPC